MNTHQIALHQMLGNTSRFAEINKAKFSDLPLFADYVTRLSKLVADIGTDSQILDVSTVGITKNKDVAKTRLVERTMDAVKCIKAYASINGNHELLSKVNFKENTLGKIHQAELSFKCKELIGIANTLLPELSAFGLTQELLEDVETAIQAYDMKSTIKPQHKGAIKAARLTIDKYFQEALSLVKDKMDPLVELIKKSDPDTYTSYKYARSIVYLPVRSVALKGKILDSISGSPIKGVQVTICQSITDSAKNGINNGKIVKKSARQGGFHVQSLNSGQFELMAIKEGYEEQRQQIYINEGESTAIQINMKPVNLG
ncbi:MAG: carboxypeptidase regulatory-like domain-containing protein [Bacteroidetes bacterium]|nr:carboxypeptidase regulatory-like domain-containing protein [Bacteroidota bacterium]